MHDSALIVCEAQAVDQLLETQLGKPQEHGEEEEIEKTRQHSQIQ
jgi:hypothetical protein